MLKEPELIPMSDFSVRINTGADSDYKVTPKTTNVPNQNFENGNRRATRN